MHLFTRHSTLVWLLAALGLTACGSSNTSSADAGEPTDGSEPTGPTNDATLGDAADATTTPEAGDASDASVPYGDRNLHLSEPYPHALLLQNGGRFYDVTAPPTASQHAAKGDGVTDDTAAFRDAFDYLRDAYVAAADSTGNDPNGTYDLTNTWIYVPDGTYRVTDTLTYRSPIVLADGGSYGELVRIRIVGESREGTTLKLDDGAAGFGDPNNPKIVLEFEHDGTVFNNWPADNVLTNMTIDVGKGNAGAVGLWFQGANQSVLYNAQIQSGDGSGACGIVFQTGSTHGYYRDLTVTGFDYGVCQRPTPGNPQATPNVDSATALEHITVRAQSKAGFLVQAGGTSLRKLWVDESTTGAVGLSIGQVGVSVVVDDSLFAGKAQGSATAAIQREAAAGEFLLARDVATTGYASAIATAGAIDAPGPTVGEFVSSTPIVLFDGGPGATLRLPVEDSPLVPWFDPATQWASVDDYGADGGADDSVAVQAAMSSGKPVVVFPRTKYAWGTPVKIPASVQRVDFLYADTGGALEVSEASAAPLLLVHHTGAAVTRTAARPLVLSAFDGEIANTNTPPANLYMENVVNIGDLETFVPPGQSTWARFIDNEQPFTGQIDVWANGGSLWVFGFKTENKPVSVFAATAGAKLEVLNGEVAQTLDQGSTFMVRNDNSTVSFVGFTELGYSPPFAPFTHMIEETQGDASAQLITDGTPQPPLVARRWVPAGTNPVDVVVPLYSGRAP